MRPLVRPALFVVARLGLFLAVLAWTVGQWMAQPLLVVGVFCAEIAEEGVAFHYVHGGTAGWTNLHVGDAGLEIERAWLFRHPPENPMLGGDTWGYSLAGITVLRSYYDLSLAFRHWLTISSFFTFNLLLHFIFRKGRHSEPV